MNYLKGKKIVLGITGSIAAYKACYLLRGLIKQGAEVQVVITPSGKHFITPTTLAALSGKPVVSEFFDSTDGSWHSHVDIGLWADMMLIAPCSASSLGKMANGVADNMLITTYLSCKAPVFVAPAMDLDMYIHASTQRNIEVLRGYGNHIIDPTSGELASHLVGKGRMEEPERIVEIVNEYFGQQDRTANPDTYPLKGKKVLITAGPTYEKIDPVRFIGNHSSGKMGMSLASVCAEQGAEVTVIAGPGVPRPSALENGQIHMVDVVSASDMYDAVMMNQATQDVLIMCAAVADYTPSQPADQKIKREAGADMTIELTGTQDIAAAVGAKKTENQILVGFALETHDAMTNAQAKLQKKNLDMIVMNSLEDAGAGFGHETNKVTLITPDNSETLPLMKKREVAAQIVNKINKL